jgi:hypothetical protein
MLVPIVVFARSDKSIEGWEITPDWKPAWWSGGETKPEAVPATPPRQPQRRGRTATAQGSLFAGIEVSDADARHTEWIGHLLGSPIFAAQRRMAGRWAPDDHTVEDFLKVLDQHHDRLSQRVLSQALGQPEFRMRGLLVVLQRLLNVEGYQVVAIDEVTGTIELNRQLLAKQFQLASCLP